MKEIRHRTTNAVLAEVPGDTLAGGNLAWMNLRGADLWDADLWDADLRGADLSDADLRGANLWDANLRGANLWDANLSDANLRGANLRDANLSGADLSGADLSGADLRGANLRDADLSGADLSGADLSDDTVMPGGETWRVYREVVVYDLLRAGGRTVREIAEAGAWDCHAWENCPMAVAFGVHGPDDVPALYAPRVKEFVALFDADLLDPWVLVASLAREQAEQAP